MLAGALFVLDKLFFWKSQEKYKKILAKLNWDVMRIAQFSYPFWFLNENFFTIFIQIIIELNFMNGKYEEQTKEEILGIDNAT